MQYGMIPRYIVVEKNDDTFVDRFHNEYDDHKLRVDVVVRPNHRNKIGGELFLPVFTHPIARFPDRDQLPKAASISMQRSPSLLRFTTPRSVPIPASSSIHNSAP